MSHTQLCKHLSKVMNLKYTDVNSAFGKWKSAGLMQGLIEGNPEVIEEAKRFDWNGKFKLQESTIEKAILSSTSKYLERSQMNSFQLQLDNVKLMAWAVSKIGSIEEAELALAKLKGQS